MDALPPIPTPRSQRWREFRIQILPIILFISVMAAIALMWKNFVQAPAVIGEVGPVQSNTVSVQDSAVGR